MLEVFRNSADLPDVATATWGWGKLASSRGRGAQSGTTATLLPVEVLHCERERAVRLDELRQGTVGNCELVDRSLDNTRSRRHVKICLREGMVYRAGDYLSVLPSNPLEIVQRALYRFVRAPDGQVVIHGAPGAPSPLPVDRPVAAATLIVDYVELQLPARHLQVTALAETISRPPKHKEAERLAGNAALAGG